MGALSFRELQQGFVHLFYPTLCEGCRRPLVSSEEVLCLNCAAQLPETGYHTMPGNQTELCFAGRIPFVRATSYAWFTADGLLQHLLHSLKYRGQQKTGVFLGQRFAQNLKETNWAQGIDLIIPVPLHPSRQASRGYNQSMIIAETLGKELGIPASDSILHRSRKTESQTNKTRTERAANMEGAFALTDPSALAGKHILIVDDVLTTGATIEACANVLLSTPGVKISIATIGIAVS